MRINFLKAGICIVFIIMFIANTPIAQDNIVIIAHKDIFGELKRSGVKFPHDLHMDVFADQDCGICHHSYDELTKSLTYQSGDETECKVCHTADKTGNVPALREAYHGSCTDCHRKTIKEKADKSGPTTCGECHIKQSNE